MGLEVENSFFWDRGLILSPERCVLLFLSTWQWVKPKECEWFQMRYTVYYRQNPSELENMKGAPEKPSPSPPPPHLCLSRSGILG